MDREAFSMQKTAVWALFFLLILSPLSFPIFAAAQIFNSQGESAGLLPAGTGQKVWDPLQSSNRKVFDFNDTLYTDFVQPLTVVYKKLPQCMRKVVHNGFENMEAPSRFVNLVLQGKPRRAGNEMTRFVINSTVGVGGMFDVAKNAFGVQDTDADFGQTLGTWYVPPGPYLVIPALGPSNARDLVGKVADSFMDPLYWVPGPFWVTWPAECFKYTDEASNHIGQYEAMKRASLDPYVAMRNAYMQHRDNMIGIKPALSVGADGTQTAVREEGPMAETKPIAQTPTQNKPRFVLKPRKNATASELADALRRAAQNDSSQTSVHELLQVYPQLAGAVAARAAIAGDPAFRPDWGQDNQQRLSIATALICSAVARGDRFTQGSRDSRLGQIRATACEQQKKRDESEHETM
jgi:phospholipid-binding lipoprotein MlaA